MRGQLHRCEKDGHADGFMPCSFLFLTRKEKRGGGNKV